MAEVSGNPNSMSIRWNCSEINAHYDGISSPSSRLAAISGLHAAILDGPAGKPCHPLPRQGFWKCFLHAQSK